MCDVTCKHNINDDGKLFLISTLFCAELPLVCSLCVHSSVEIEYSKEEKQAAWDE